MKTDPASILTPAAAVEYRARTGLDPDGKSSAYVDSSTPSHRHREIPVAVRALFVLGQCFAALLCLVGLGIIVGEVYSPFLGLASVLIGLWLGAVGAIDRRLREIRDRLPPAGPQSSAIVFPRTARGAH